MIAPIPAIRNPFTIRGKLIQGLLMGGTNVAKAVRRLVGAAGDLGEVRPRRILVRRSKTGKNTSRRN
jgi:hypothetical protein